jgi:hypothetical protein
MKPLWLALLPLAAAACSGTPPVAVGNSELSLGRGALAVDHVLLVSVDGLHGVDLARFVAAHPDSTLARLRAHGLTYANAAASRPSDSFPGLLALVTGGSPASTGVYYDDSYDGALSAPGSDCSVRGAEIVFDESIDKDPAAIDGGGGIDPAKLPRDPARGCAPVYPHQFLRVNTIFEVVRDAGGRTAWSDKHPAYDLVNGPSGKGVVDLFTPEIAATDGTVAGTEAYDDSKVAAVVNEIYGFEHDGDRYVGTPRLFGLNFQAVSVAQKSAGYADAAATPTADLADALEHTDASLGQLLDALDAVGLARRTLVVVTAKHGQSPIDRAALKIVDKKLLAKAVDAAQITADDVAYIWLKDAIQVPAALAVLEAQREALAIDRIYSGADLDLLFGAEDARRPDLAIEPHAGVIYTKPTATKVAEHGGLADDDTHVALLLSNPRLPARTIATPVATMQVAPTLLSVLGLPPQLLAAVVMESTQTLPLR